MTQHTHSLKDLFSRELRCFCGALICSMLHPKEGVGCLLEEGHPGDHVCPSLLNGKYPEVRWPSFQQPPCDAMHPTKGTGCILEAGHPGVHIHLGFNKWPELRWS